MSNLTRTFAILTAITWGSGTFAAHGQLELLVRDGESGAPLSARIQLTNSKGRRIVPRGMQAVGDRCFYVYGSTVLELPSDTYQFTIDRGAEYRPHHGHFVISGSDLDHQEVKLTRFVDMSERGWWSADLQVHDPPKLLPLRMDAEELYLAAAFAKRVGDGVETREGPDVPSPLEAMPAYEQTAFDGRSRSPLLLVHAGGEPPPWLERVPELPVGWLTPDYHQEGCFAFAGSALTPALPIWLASRALDGVGVIAPEPGDYRDWQALPPLDGSLIPAPTAQQQWGKWNEFVYYQMLECGLRVPPLAMSGAGWVRTHPGSARSYAHLRGRATSEEWWRSLQRGRLMITNGPLMIIRVNGRPPGYQFAADPGETVDLTVDLTLHTKQTVEYLEIIKNGTVQHSIRLDEWAKANGRLPELSFEQSGWMLVRAVTNDRERYQLAMSAPYFIQIGDRPRVSRKAVQFFQDWLSRLPTDAPHARFHRAASRFWQSRLEAVTTD